MKKLLSLLAAGGLVVSSTANIVACTQDEDYNNPRGAFQLETNSITLNVTETNASISVLNSAILVDEARPTIFEFSEEGIINAQFSDISDNIVITLLAGEEAAGKTIQITVSSELGFSREITVNIDEIELETNFRLENNNVTIDTLRTTYINITNFRQLKGTSYHPSIFEFSEEGFATAELDSANERINIRANNLGTDNLTLKISSQTGENVEIVTININVNHIDLNDANLVTTIIAGSMVNGVIDASVAIGNSNFVVTEESIIDSFNAMNGINLNASEIEITTMNQVSGSQGSSYLISAVPDSEVVIGAAAIVTNQNVLPSEMMINRDLGDARFFTSFLTEQDAAVGTAQGRQAIASIMLQYVGARNHIMEYIAPNILNAQLDALALATQAQISVDTYIPHWPSLGGIFVREHVEFFFRMVEEDRLSILDGLDGRNVNVSTELLASARTNLADLYEVQTIVYNELNEYFRSVVSLAEFRQFARINQRGNTFFLDVLPGSTVFYGHDVSAWFTFISPWWSSRNFLGTINGTIAARLPEARYMIDATGTRTPGGVSIPDIPNPGGGFAIFN